MQKKNNLDWKNTITPSTFLMRLGGVWPSGDEGYGYNLYTLYSIVTITFFHVCFLIPEMINLYFTGNDLKTFTGTLYSYLSKAGATLKTYYLVKNIKMLKRLLKEANADIFQPRNPQQRDLIKPTIKLYKFVVRSFLFFCFLTLFMWCFYAIFDKTYKEYRLPFPAWFPFNTKTSPAYELTYIYQSIAINVLAMANINIDLLIAGLNMFIGAQFDILCSNLRNLHEAGDVNKRLLHCIQHHRETLKFADHTNQFYNWLLFAQFFTGGISIGITMFQLTIVNFALAPMSNEYILMLFYAATILVEVFMYCWFGNEVAVKSSNLSYAVFECDWTAFSAKVKKNIIIFVLRAQNSLKISSFGLFYLSLDTYMAILRTSWSYFALLRQVNAPQ